MITIDGRLGEGGGQVLRSALALSLATGSPCRIEHIRAGRAKPGLRPQHLASVRAATFVGEAEVEGATKGSSTLEFVPHAVRPGTYHVDVGTAGSASLVLQTVLPPLLTAAGGSTITVEGGTHNPLAPPFDFLDRVLFPVLERMGPRLSAKLERYGFAPVGQGRMTVEIDPVARLAPLDLLERGRARQMRARALLANLPLHIAERELRVVGKKLGWPARHRQVEPIAGAKGPGNALLLEVACEHITEIVTGFGELGVRAETVASRACFELLRYLSADAPVGEHLADQLLLPMALGPGGRFRTLPLSSHAMTQIELIQRFLDVRVDVEPMTVGGVDVVLHEARSVD